MILSISFVGGGDSRKMIIIERKLSTIIIKCFFVCLFVYLNLVVKTRKHRYVFQVNSTNYQLVTHVCIMDYFLYFCILVLSIHIVKQTLKFFFQAKRTTISHKHCIHSYILHYHNDYCIFFWKINDHFVTRTKSWITFQPGKLDK